MSLLPLPATVGNTLREKTLVTQRDLHFKFGMKLLTAEFWQLLFCLFCQRNSGNAFHSWRIFPMMQFATLLVIGFFKKRTGRSKLFFLLTENGFSNKDKQASKRLR